MVVVTVVDTQDIVAMGMFDTSAVSYASWASFVDTSEIGEALQFSSIR